MIIREIDSISEMKALERLQQDVWGWNNLDTMPLVNFIIMSEIGGVLIGAFDQETLVGFVFGFVGYDEGQIVLHSHMLGVLPAFRGQGIGRKLKLAQRQQALAKGFHCITWTFDPLVSTNAYLNLSRLGAIATKYKVNFYGEQSSSALHRHIGTDRLWASWFLESNRVNQRLKCGLNAKHSQTDLRKLGSLVQMGPDGWPQIQPLAAQMDEQVLIDIPADIGLLQQQSPELAAAWRNATRSAFTEAFAAGFTVQEFYRLDRYGQLIGCYLLSSKMPDGINDSN